MQDTRSDVVIDALSVTRGGHDILHGITATLEPGSITGLLGPSGCGKTTLMRAIVGVQAISGGSVTVFGAEPGARKHRGRVGYVTQQASVYQDLTVAQNLEYFHALSAGSGAGEVVRSTLDAVGLGEVADRKVENLSGGQRGRASLACALVGDPDLLVLDEPTVGLDPLTREDLWARFRDLAAAGRTLLISSHVMDEASRCDQLMLMRDGTLLGIMTPDELLRRTGATNPDEAFLTLIRSREGRD